MKEKEKDDLRECSEVFETIKQLGSFKGNRRSVYDSYLS